MLLLATLLLLQAPANLDALGALSPPLPGTLRVYLVRHGQALSNLDPEPDLPPEQLDHLTSLGQSQADRAGRALAGHEVALVLTSPASRAGETAARLAAVLHAAPPTVEPRLQPLALGHDPSGKPLDWDARIADWAAGRDPSPPGGESMGQMGARVDELVLALAAERRDRTVVLVAHGEVIGAYLGRLRGIPAPKRYPPDIANGSITAVDVGPDGRPHLRLANHRPAEP
jgi:broad specificity phosphatase PhoE